MDQYLDTVKARMKRSLQDEVNQTQTILGEAFYRKDLWKSADKDSYIAKMVVKNGNIFYQMEDETNILKLNGHCQSITSAEFYEPFLQTITRIYPEPQFLTLGETVVKTEQPYRSFYVAEHFTKKIYFIAYEYSPAKDESLYAAYIGKGVKEVVAEKVEIGTEGVTDNRLTALAVDQISGDIILARATPMDYRTRKLTVRIQTWQKLSHLSEWLTFAGISISKENVEEEES